MRTNFTDRQGYKYDIVFDLEKQRISVGSNKALFNGPIERFYDLFGVSSELVSFVNRMIQQKAFW